MKLLLYTAICYLLWGCHAMKKLDNHVFIQQRSPIPTELPRIDSLLIVANGNSATRQIMDDIIPIFQQALQERGISSQRLFVSYNEQRINEQEFDNRQFGHVLWIYEQDRKLQQLEKYTYLIPIAIKLTDNSNSKNIWIATSIFNNFIKNKYYKEKYAGTLALLLRANGFIK